MRSSHSSRGDLRLFVAVYPPPELVRSLISHMHRLALPEHRETPGGQVHLTLRFIGDTAPKDLERVRESVERSVSGIDAFELMPQRIVTLPRKGPARLIAATTDTPPLLLEVHRRMAHRMARTARKNAGDRFLPHLTLCRFAPGVLCKSIDEEIGADPFVVETVSLVKSVLRPGGASHAEIARFPLSGA